MLRKSRAPLLGPRISTSIALLAAATASAIGPASIESAPEDLATPFLRIDAVFGDATRADSPLCPTAESFDWYLLANHCHSEYSHDSSTDLELLLWETALRGADAMVLTDHRTYAGCSDDEFQPVLDMVPICGQEWGSSPHAGIIHVPADTDPMDGYSIPDMIDGVTAAGGTIVANHPFFDGDPWPEERLSAGIDVIEVWNGPWWWGTEAASKNQQAARWWQDHLEEGRRVSAIGGSDKHYVGLNPLYPCNYVYAASNQAEDIQDAIEAGRLGISRDESGPRVFLWADADGGLDYDLPMGSNISVTTPSRIYIRVPVKNGEGEKLFLYTHQGIVWSGTVDSANWELRASGVVEAGARAFVRAELRGTRTNYMKSMTNPIFANFPEE
ncbi:MAG: hypothetical protein CME06_12175 [Gemmatimonadetes bacterium]|nr:hypothetical protein [Gemmatimonadota bacterium]